MFDFIISLEVCFLFCWKVLVYDFNEYVVIEDIGIFKVLNNLVLVSVWVFWLFINVYIFSDFLGWFMGYILIRIVLE